MCGEIWSTDVMVCVGTLELGMSEIATKQHTNFNSVRTGLTICGYLMPS